jgi:RNA polymerase sigma-70 factor (ECF subfamily)
MLAEGQDKMTVQDLEPIANQSELVKRARDGDEDAFGAIINLYRHRVIGYCYRMIGSDAEDIAQEIFIKFYLALYRFDSSKPIKPFLFRIAHNHCVDILKKKTIRTIPFLKNNEEKQELQVKDERPDPEEWAQKAELQNALNHALAAIPVLYRSPLLMWHVEGIPYEEIAKILELPMGTVKARIHRGRKILQQKLMSFVVLNGE